MCTLILDWHPNAMLLLANRDERLDRPAEGWSLRTTARGTPILAPRDVTAGGTWVGINRHGLLAALTNHHTGFPPDAARASRGVLVEDMLDHATAAAARADVASRNAQHHNPFHLVVADAHSAFLWHSTLEHAHLEDLEAGLHVVTESHPHGEGARGTLIRSAFRADMTPERAHQLLATHHQDPRQAMCVHLGEIYGTRSSVMLSPHPRVLHVADQRPCVTPWTDARVLLDQLLDG